MAKTKINEAFEKGKVEGVVEYETKLRDEAKKSNLGDMLKKALNRELF
jgi:hypothetical protein